MRRVFGLTIVIVFLFIPGAYGAGSVWKVADARGLSEVRRLPDAPETLEIWDFWEGEGLRGGGSTGSLPLPGGRGDLSEESRPRGIGDPPERLEIWDFWEGEGDGGGGGSGLLPLPAGVEGCGEESRPRGIGDPPERLEIWVFWEPEGSLEVWDFAGGEE